MITMLQRMLLGGILISFQIGLEEESYLTPGVTVLVHGFKLEGDEAGIDPIDDYWDDNREFVMLFEKG